MKEWVSNGFNGLQSLRWETRVIYTLFLLFSIAGYGVMSVLMATRSGFTPRSIATYYIGNEAQGIYGKTFSELLELTHFHLFAIPLLLFVLGHVFLLTKWPLKVKVVIVLAAFLGAAGFIAAPWLIVYASPAWAVLSIAGRTLLGIGLLVFLVVPLREMWSRK